MSLWNKRLSEIDYSDIEDFCKAGYPEGPQLDYKREIPKDLAKLVAAFANTRGGLILLGIDADQTTNLPNWPCEGMELKPGLSERIMQICRDNLYPSVMPEISSPIENPNDPTKTFMVVRVDESSFAPHSMRNTNRLYVRTGDTNDPIDLMHIDKIESLLKRRVDLELSRETLLNRHLERSASLLTVANQLPLFWCYLSPLFPDNDICELETCQHALFKARNEIRAPDGYIGFNKIPCADAGERITGVLSSTGRKGDIFYSRVQPKIHADDNFNLHFHVLCKTVLEFTEHCQGFLSREDVSRTGQLVCSVGVRRAKSSRMNEFFGRFSDEVGPEFPDASYRRDIVVSQYEFLEEATRHQLALSLMKELGHAFGLAPPPEDMSLWDKTIH